MAPPTVLVFSGNDPSGGAGMLADCATLSALGCHSAPILTALTTQNTLNVQGFTTVSADDVLAQARFLSQDVDIRAIKIGMVGSIDNILAISTFLKETSNIPVVLDPVLVATGGGQLSRPQASQALAQLFPYTTVITPNTPEALTITHCQSIEQAGPKLHQLGAANCVITGGDNPETKDVVNTLYEVGKLSQQFSYRRLPGNFHGSGCTFASALAGFLAQGKPLAEAVNSAGAYTERTLQHAYRPGKGPAVPNRLMAH